MGLFDIFRKKGKVVDNSIVNYKKDDVGHTSRSLGFMEERIKYFYEHPETLVDIEFSNRTEQKVNIWIELTCVSIDLDQHTEYKIVTHDRYFRMEFDENNRVIFYLQYSFGFKLFKRPISQDSSSKTAWQLDLDLSDIN